MQDPPSPAWPQTGRPRPPRRGSQTGGTRDAPAFQGVRAPCRQILQYGTPPKTPSRLAAALLLFATSPAKHSAAAKQGVLPLIAVVILALGALA